VTTQRKEPAEPMSPRPAARPFIPHQQLSKEDLLELQDPYGLELPERPDGWPIRPPEYVIVLAASDWYKEHFPAAGAGLWDALHPGYDRHRDPEPDLEAEP
jgi:hypothetical protein